MDSKGAATDGSDQHVGDAELRANAFFGLASKSRALLAGALAEGELTVRELAARTRLSRANTSHQLGAMWSSGIVARQRRGVEVFYRLVPGVAELLVAVDDLHARAEATDGAASPPGPDAVREWAGGGRNG